MCTQGLFIQPVAIRTLKPEESNYEHFDAVMQQTFLNLGQKKISVLIK